MSELTQAEERKRFKWTVEFEVAGIWVADGFEMTDERALDMLQDELGWAFEHELSAKIIKSPDVAEIRRIQGYEAA